MICTAGQARISYVSRRTGAATIECLPVDRLASRLSVLCARRQPCDAYDDEDEEIGRVVKDEDTGRFVWWSV